MKSKPLYLSALSLVVLPLTSNAATFLVDFGTSSTTAATTTDVYNTVANQTGTATDNPLARSTNGPGVSNGTISDAALEDTAGVTSTLGVSLHGYTNGGGQLRSGNGFVHDPVAGIEAFALEDGYWMNNHNGNGTGAGSEFGMVLTFSGLTEAFYDVSVFSTSTNHSGSWSVTTGTGDTDAEAFAGTNSVAQWTTVAPVGGVITLTSISAPADGTFENMGINAASITSVPEPSSALLGFCGFVLLLRRCR